MEDANNLNKTIGAKYLKYDISDSSHRTGITYSLHMGDEIKEISFSQEGGKEMRADYDLSSNMVAYVIISHLKKKVLFMDTSIDSLRAQYSGYKVITNTIGDKQEYLIYVKDNLTYRFVIKGDLKNIHYSSILFPEVTELPELIETKGTRYELAQVYTLRQYESLHKYLQHNFTEDYEIFDHDDLRNAIQKEFGMDYDEFVREMFNEIDLIQNEDK